MQKRMRLPCKSGKLIFYRNAGAELLSRVPFTAPVIIILLLLYYFTPSVHQWSEFSGFGRLCCFTLVVFCLRCLDPKLKRLKSFRVYGNDKLESGNISNATDTNRKMDSFDVSKLQCKTCNDSPPSTFIFLFSVTALLVGEKLPPEAELDVSPTYSAAFSCAYLNQLVCVLTPVIIIMFYY